MGSNCFWASDGALVASEDVVAQAIAKRPGGQGNFHPRTFTEGAGVMDKIFGSLGVAGNSLATVDYVDGSVSGWEGRLSPLRKAATSPAISAALSSRNR